LAIIPTTSVKYLGATLDQTLSFTEMAQSLLKKANTRLKFVYRNKQYLTQHTKTLLVMSFMQCHYEYACSIWYKGLNKVLKNKLQTTQNKLILFVLDLESRAHFSKDHFESLNWLPVNSRVDHLTLCHVLSKWRMVFLLNIWENIVFVKMVFIPIILRLCSKGTFVIPKVKSHRLKSFCYNRCSLWNSLPHTCSNITNLSFFKVALKQHLLSSF